MVSTLISLEGLNTVSGNITMAAVELSNLEGLDNLSYIGGNLNVSQTNNLTSLSGLNSLSVVEGEISIGMWEDNGQMGVYANTSLTNFCALQNLFTNGTYSTVNIANNAYNPTVQDIVDGNCSQ